MKTLILVRGCPGSGKSTLAEFLAAKDDSPVFSADMYHEDEDGNYNYKPENSKAGHEWCRGMTEIAMQTNHETIYVANTFTRKWEMDAYFKLAADYGYRVTTIVVENRHGSKDIHNVPADTISAMKGRFEVML